MADPSNITVNTQTQYVSTVAYKAGAAHAGTSVDVRTTPDSGGRVASVTIYVTLATDDTSNSNKNVQQVHTNVVEAIKTSMGSNYI